MKYIFTEDRVIGLFNFSDKPAKIETAVEKGSWQRLFASAAEEWGGMGVLVPNSILATDSESVFVLDRYAFALYRWTRSDEGIRQGRKDLV